MIELNSVVIYCGFGMGEVLSGPGFRTCSHAGCAWPASATLSFDYESRRAWLDDLRPGEDPSTYDLCAVHAGRFRPPKGWASEDRRRMPEPVIPPSVPAEGSAFEQIQMAGNKEDDFSAGSASGPERIALPEI